ncbi:MAG: glycosyltransferase family 4 protein [Cruoricaptor ignavus]|nr:glycosyltransferase family 4 protein [Cruoricaptor ignavus]
MNILIFYQYFGTPKGKWSTRMYEMTRRWVKQGHKVTVVTAPYEKSDIRANKFIERQNIEGIDIIVINSADSNRDPIFKRIYKAVVFSLVSVYFSLTSKYDIAMSSSGPITVGLPGLFAKKIRNKKFVFEVRDLWPAGAVELGKLKNKFLINIATGFEKLCYKNADLVVPCSKGMEEGVLHKWPSANTLVITNASDNTLFDNINELPLGYEQYANKKIFIYAGSLGIMDEVEQVLFGMEKLQNSDIQLVIIGDGAERKHLEELTLKMNLNNVSFLGLMPKTEVVKWFKVAQASFVTFKDLPVLQTSSPNKMFDSFSASVPIIQSTKGWIKKMVDETNCGINVNPKNPQEFANAMEMIASNPELQKQMAENAKKQAMYTFDRNRLALLYIQKMVEIFNQK